MMLHLTPTASAALPVGLAIQATHCGYSLTVHTPNGVAEIDDAVAEGIRGTCNGTLTVRADGTADFQIES